MTEPVYEIEGTWEEILSRAPEFRGARVRLTVVSPGPDSQVTIRRPPYDAMLAFLQRVAEIQRGMRETPGGESQTLLREARSGAMYGDSPTE